MDNNDSITPQDFAKQMGAYPNAPYNPVPVGGFMDEGFNWVLGAESYSADFGMPTEGEEFTTMQVRIGSPSGSTTSWTHHFDIKCVGDEDNLSYLTSDIEDVVVDRVMRWNGDEEGDFTTIQVVIGSSSGTSGSWYRVFTVECLGEEVDNLSYLTSDIEDVVVDRVKSWNGDEVSYNAESYSQIMGPTIEANEGNLHSPSSFDITWEDGTGQSSASMPPNEIHFGASGDDGYYRPVCVGCYSDNIKDNKCLDCGDFEDSASGRAARTHEEDAITEEMALDAMNEMVKNLGNVAYNEFCYRFDIDPEDAEEMSWFIADHYDSPKVISWLEENHDNFSAEEGYDFQKMTPSPYTPFDQIGNELQQQRDESGPMLEPTNANFGAERHYEGNIYCYGCGLEPRYTPGQSLEEIKDDYGKKVYSCSDCYEKLVYGADSPSPTSPLEDGWWNCKYCERPTYTDYKCCKNADVSWDAESPSPASPLEEVPALVPSPAEPSNSNFNSEHKRDYVTMILGTAALVVGSGMFAKSQGWLVTDTKAADTDDLPSIDPTVNDGLVASPTTGDLLPADYEEMIVESTGYAVPIIPISLDPSFIGSRFQALPTDRLVDSNEPGIGAHTDVAMYRDTLYREPEQSMVQAPSLNAEGDCNCSLLDKIMAFFKGEECGCETEVKESQGVGQTPYFGFGFERKNPQLRVIKETGPISLDPSVAPYLPQNLSGYTGQAYRPPSIYGDMMGLGMAGASVPFINPNESTVGENRYGSNPVDSSTLQSIHGNLSSSTNSSYNNGSQTMSLAQWSIDYDVSQTSDSEAVAVSRSSGIRTMIRRV